MAMRSPIDSYYDHTIRQLASIGAVIQIGYLSDGITPNIIAQPICGYTEARDWPGTPPREGALYLTTLSKVPIGGTKAQVKYRYYCQWSWLLVGYDVTQQQVAQNRANRYNTNAQIEENIRQANFPGFCQLRIYSLRDQDGDLSSNPIVSLYPRSEPEMITWSDLKFMPRSDNQQSGLLFCAAAVEIEFFSDVNPVLKSGNNEGCIYVAP